MKQKSSITSGDVFWVRNSLLENKAISFEDDSSDGFHPVVVMNTRSGRAEVRVMTSKLERYQGRGILYRPASEVRLNRTGVVLTIPESHQKVPVAQLQPDNYLGNIGPHVLGQIRRSERDEIYGDLGIGHLRRLLWLILGGGLLTSLFYIAAGLIFSLTVVGIPIGMRAFRLARFSLSPFHSNISARKSKLSPNLQRTMRIIWLLLFGIWIALVHIILMLFTGITIVGIPFAKEHWKLAKLALNPFGE